MSAPTDALRGRDLIGLGGLLAGAVVAGIVLGLLVDDAAGTVAGVHARRHRRSASSPAGVGFWLRVRAALRG